MASTLQKASSTKSSVPDHFDAIVIGAGVSGLYQLYRLRQLGLKVRVFDDGDGVGGTWYWNRYPGARFDSESYTYGYSFSDELLQEWDWKEHFSGQPENERYLNYVADKFGLRRDIQFNSRVSSAYWDENAGRWEVCLDGGTKARTRFLIAATGLLSAHYMPHFEGLESFKGDWFHTARWPHQDPQLADKRVGVIGTGATAVQLITEIAKEVGHLTVFQRTPNYCAPLRNGPIDAETQAKIKASYPEIFRRTRESFAGFLHNFDTRSFFDVPAEKRQEFYEELWKQPGFAKWLGNFPEIMTNTEANEEYAEFVRIKIRERVKDPAVADKLVPKDHPFGSKRIPLESGYYEVFNRDNVTLVDIRESPIWRITPAGLRTRAAEYPLDVIIFATGFVAITGPLTRMDIRGESQQQLKDQWADGPRSYLGIQTAGFPNFFIANAATFCNVPRCLEMVVDWISDCIGYLSQRGLMRIAPSTQAEQAWTDHVNELAAGTLLTKADSWFMGANIPGKARAILLYANSAPAYRQKLQEVAEKKYEGFILG